MSTPHPRPARGRRLRPGTLALLLTAPVLACEIVVHVIPTVLGVFLSLHRIDQFTLRDWVHAPWVGGGNYRIAVDPGAAVGSALISSFAITVAFTVIVVALCWAIGMFAAVLLSVPFRGRTLLQLLFLVPFALPAYVTGVGWRFLLARDTGAVNHVLVDQLRLFSDRPFWLVGDHAFWATVLVSVWRLWPFACLMLLAALTTVPRELYEDAALNGAGAWQQFRRVSLPAIRRPNALVLLVLVLWTFNEFTVPWVLFGGSPPPSATLLSTLVYREAFGSFDVGIAAAINVVMTLLLLLAGGLWARRAFTPTEAAR